MDYQNCTQDPCTPPGIWPVTPLQAHKRVDGSTPVLGGMLKDTNEETRAAGKSQQPEDEKEHQKTVDKPEPPESRSEARSKDSASEDPPCAPGEEDLQVIPRPAEERAEGYLQEWMRRFSRT